jgi:predicted 3-demethylubiquinone-9 3-methyltransferase (glyoxalase superfamily)
MKQKITTFLTFDDQAEEAAKLYTSLFDRSKITATSPGPGGKAMSVSFELDGQSYLALNGGPSFSFANGISLFVSCETQAEVDHFWSSLTADGGS